MQWNLKMGAVWVRGRERWEEESEGGKGCENQFRIISAKAESEMHKGILSTSVSKPDRIRARQMFMRFF